MSIGVLSPGLVTDLGPILESSALASGCLRRQQGGRYGNPIITTGVTGTFTLERDGQKILDAVTMTQNSDGWLTYVIADTLMLRGQYTWKMRLVETTSGLASTFRGRFILK